MLSEMYPDYRPRKMTLNKFFVVLLVARERKDR